MPDNSHVADRFRAILNEFAERSVPKADQIPVGTMCDVCGKQKAVCLIKEKDRNIPTCLECKNTCGVCGLAFEHSEDCLMTVDKVEPETKRCHRHGGTMWVSAMDCDICDRKGMESEGY